MNRALRAIAGGIAGTAVLTFFLVLLEVETRSQAGVFDSIARFVGLPGRLTVGFVLFVAAGILAWPLLFIAVEQYLPRGPDPAARGVVFAAVLWLAFVLVGTGDFGGQLLFIYAAFTLIAHLLYGFTLGAVYARLGSDVEAV